MTSKFGDELRAAEEDLELVDAEFAARRIAGDNIAYDYTLFDNSFAGPKAFANYINIARYFGKGSIVEKPSSDRSKRHDRKMKGNAGFVSMFILLSKLYLLAE
jgi:hypothetical protein